MLNLDKKKLLLFFYFLKLLIKFDYNKFSIIWLYFNFIKLKYNHIYYNILNLLRIYNKKLLLFLFEYYNIISYYKIYNMLFLIELDKQNLYFVKFKSNFFCNWRFFNSSYQNYDNFNLRISFFLYFRYTKYIEYFRAFKYYEYLSRWSIFKYKNQLFDLSKHINMNNLIIYISDVIYVRIIFCYIIHIKFQKYINIVK